MFFHTIKQQCLRSLRQKRAAFVFYTLLVLVLVNFLSNVFEYRGSDILDMIHPAKLLLLSFNRTYENADPALLLIQLYPVLVVLPAGFLLLSEKHRKEDALLISRIGAFRYYGCGLLSAFLVTAVIFTVPFLLELLLNCISFPLAATGDFWGENIYDPTYREMTKAYLFSGVYARNPYLYSIVGILFAGFVSGVLGMFTAAISVIFPFRYKILLFLPVIFMLNIHSFLLEFIHPGFSIRWFDYVLLFNDLPKSGGFLAVCLLLLCAASMFCACHKAIGDHL